MLVICLEGNIGVGKSTVWNRLRTLFDGDARVAFVAEPVAEWEAMGFLERMYTDPSSRAAFQLTALVSLTADLAKAMRGPTRIVITERSPWSNRATFAKHTLGADDLAMYEYAWQRLVDGLPAASVKYVYLSASVDILQERMQKRGREAETGLPTSYLQKLSALHDDWLLGDADVHRVDASESPESVFRVVAEKVVEWVDRSPVDHTNHRLDDVVARFDSASRSTRPI